MFLSLPQVQEYGASKLPRSGEGKKSPDPGNKKEAKLNWLLGEHVVGVLVATNSRISPQW
jgi:hypothetical protein